jgi:hypothetical protein
MAISRQAQAFYLGSAPHLAGAGAAYKLSGTAQIPLLLEDLIVSSTATGTISTITLAGQSMMSSDSSAPIGMFSADAQLEGFRSVSCPIGTNQKFEISGTMNAPAANIGMAVSTSPIAPQQYVPTSQLGGALNYVFGVEGTGNVPAAAAGVNGTVTFTATCLRDCLLGRIVVVNQDGAGVPSADLNITSILCEGIELLSGQSNVDVVNIEVLGPKCTDLSGLQLNYPITANGQLRVTVENANGAAGGATVGIGVFCLPA